jgi:hypothetical protein
MSPRHIFMTQALTYAGTFPLIIAVFVAYAKIPGMDPLFMVRSYAAVVIAFLSGIHWAAFLFFSSKCPRNLLITSNATALFCWASLLFPDQKLSLALQSLCFLYLLVLDFKLKQAKVLPVWFYALRHNATAIVIMCLMMLELT